MKPLTPALAALLRTDNFLIGDIFQFTLNDGAADFFSGLDVPVVWNGNTYRADGLRIEGLKLKLAVGLQVDSQAIRIGATPQDTLAGALFLANVGAGLLDGATLQRSRAFWSATPLSPAATYLTTPIGVVTLSTMLVSEITKVGRTHVEMTVKSPTKLLDLNMPRNFYSSGCVHTLYDSGCTLVKSAFGVSGQVGSGASALVVPWSGGVVTPTGGDGLENYAQGRLLFTSGNLANLQVSVINNDSNNLYLFIPLGELPAAGDHFTVFPGCSKTMNTCSAKFNNILNFRGFPFTPQVYVSV